MNFVEPIRSKEKIEQMKCELKKRGTRDYLLFVFGINIGLRISDILELKVKDILNENGTMKDYIELKEQKTKKRKQFKINQMLGDEIRQFLTNSDIEEYVFKSRNGRNTHISRVQAYRILNKTAQICGLEQVGTHTLRKTFAYHFYLQTHDIALLQQLFNHSSPSITLRYIGINQDIVDNALNNFNL